MKTINKVLSILAMSTLLVGCGTNKNNKNESNNYSNSEGSGSSSSEQEPELTGVDKIVADFLSGTGVSIPSLNAYDMSTEIWYYAYYEQYVITASVATTEALDVQYNDIVKNSSLINCNDDDYTIEDYGYIYLDNTSSPKIQMYFYVEDSVFYVDIYREDGKYGTADVSNVDTSWYVDYLRFYGFEKGTTFPGAEINTFLSTNVEIPAPTANYFVYGGVEAGLDDYGDYNPDTYYVFTDGDVSVNYAEALKDNTNFVVNETTDLWGYAVYEVIDKGNNIVISFEEGYDNTQIIFRRFADVYTTEKTTRTDWADEEKALMNECLGEVLPFIALGEDYVVEADDFLGFYWISISDTYYKNLLDDYANLLVLNGFTGSNGSYVKDNRTTYLEVELYYESGNSITVYYEESRYVPATKVELAFDEVDVVPGYSGLELNPVLTPKDASSVVTHSSSSEYATVTAAGIVNISESCPADTDITITATAEEGVTDTCVIHVKQNKVTGAVFNATSLELAPGESFQIEILHYLPLGATFEGTISYSQKTPVNSEISVDENGKVTIVENATIGGTAVIVVTYGALTQEIPVTVAKATETDTLTAASFDVTGTTYGDHTATGVKGTYSAYCAGGNSSIQIRSKDTPHSGLIGSNNDKICKSISVTFEEHTSAERTVDIYASNEAFTIDNMYDESLTKVGSLVYDGENATMTYNFEADYKYIGLRSSSGAIYMSSVQIIWR